MEARSSNKRRLTRRHVLKTGAAALGAGTGLLNGPPVLEAQSTQAPAQAPGLVTGTQTGRSFRGLTLEDPTMYTRPWKMAFPLRRNTQQGYYLLEFACHEGERDLQHYTDDTGRPKEDRKP